ncbi:hypothetical protein ACS0TY_006381 [Phlomoides rotata]
MLRCPHVVHTWGTSPFVFYLSAFHRCCLDTFFWTTFGALPPSDSFPSNPRQKKSRDAQNPQYLKWQPPPLGGLKLNTDAASFSDGTVGCGFVLRTNSGNVVLAGSKWMKGAGNSTLLEALALRFANGQELWYPMLSRGDGLSEPGLGPSKGV